MNLARFAGFGLVLLAACGDSGGASASGTSSTADTGATETAGTTAPGVPTTTTPTGGASEGLTSGLTSGVTTGPDATSTVDPTAAPGTSSGTSGTSSAATGTAGDDSTTGAPFEPNGCVTSVDGWCWTYPLPHGNRLHDIWDDGQGRVWVAGEGGTLMYHDGQQWTTPPAEHPDDLRGIWGAAPDDIWAVGDFGKVLHYDGVGWSVVPSGTKKWLNAVHGFATDDVWAVGDLATVLHWDGVAWSPVAGKFGGDQISLWGSAADDVWIGGVGFGGPITHWDGATWSPRSIDNAGSVTALWGSGPQDVYATRDQGLTFLDHWTGDPQWDEIDTPFGVPLYAVVGDGERIYAGGRGALLEVEGGTYTEHPDFVWTETQDLAKVGDDIIAVGERGSIARRAGGSWAFEHGDASENRLGFGAIAGNGPDDIWAGAQDTAHWDGEKWTFVDIGQGSQSFLDMSAADGVVWGLTWNGDHWLWRCVDGVWTEEAKLTSWGAWELWAQDASTVWVAVEYVNVTIARWDGQTMKTWHLGTTVGASDIHGLGPADIWAVGPSETLYHWDGVDWTKVHATANGVDTDQVWAAGPNDVWVGGSTSGSVYHWDGVTWAAHKVSNWGAADLWGSGPNDLFAVSGSNSSPGIIYHWDGVAWTEQISGQGEGLAAIWGVDKDVWVVGGKSSALVLRR